MAMAALRDDDDAAAAAAIVDEPLSSPRIVHFSSECAVIPESPTPHGGDSRWPKLVTKQFSLPLWKRRVPSSSDVEGDDNASEDIVAVHLREEVVSVKVPIPSFRTRSSSRERTPSNPPTPILVRRESLGSSNPHRRPPVRRPSLPPTRTSLPPLMVPLRDCCADCMPIVEESLREGDAWSEHFTRGARRRRSLSVDSAHGHKHVHTASFASIKVDEAASGPPAHRCPSPPPPTSVTVTAATLPSQFGLGPSLTRRIPSDSSASEGGVIDLTEPVPPKAVPTPPAPIQEEDEEELFPLPSPRRSPSGSPLIPSPAGSTASLVVRNSPALSPAIAALKQQNYPGELKPPPSPSLSVSVPRTYSPVRRTSPATSPTMPYRSPATSPTIGPPSPGVKTPSSHHSWSSFFRGGASVLKGMNSIAG